MFAGMGLEIYIKNEKAILRWWQQYRDSAKKTEARSSDSIV